MHEIPPPGEATDAARKREKREHERIVCALRALDPEALAAYRTKGRLRKRVQAAKRASQLPALPIPDGDAAWFAPESQQPRFIGESVWHSTGSETAPSLAVVEQLYRDHSADLRLESGTVVTHFAEWVL